MKRNRFHIPLAAFLVLCCLAAGVFAAVAAGAVPSAAEEVKNDVTVYSNAKAAIDASNLGEGFITVAYTGGLDVRIKVQVVKLGAETDPNGIVYTYDLNNRGDPETFPLTEGDGVYKVTVFENTTGTKYAQAYSVQLTLKLRDEFSPFLCPNQYVNYTPDSKVVALAVELTRDQAKTLDKVQAVYMYVTNSFTYDKVRSKTVKSGYLPEVDKVLEEKKGICFDYSAVMTSMLRSQGVPCKLIVGYAGKTYHAWINVYVDGVGWIDKVIQFDGKSWTLMDPTYVSSGKHSKSILKYVTTESNYVQKYAY